MSGWEEDVAMAVRRAYAERRAISIYPVHTRRASIGGRLYTLWRLWLLISLWSAIGRLWRLRYVGKLLAALAVLGWVTVALSLLNHALPAAPSASSSPAGSSTMPGDMPLSGLSGFVPVDDSPTRLGDWDISINGYQIVKGATDPPDGHKFTWLLVRWTLSNPSGTAVEVSTSDFSATTFGVNELGTDPSEINSSDHALPEGYLTPGETINGDVVFEVFRTARTINVTFAPTDGNPQSMEETWKIAR